MLDSVYTEPDPQGHDMKLNTFKMSEALKFVHDITEFNDN